MSVKYKRKELKISDKLMKKIANFDPIAFEELYNKASGAVFGLAMSLVANQTDAEDIVQETFLTIYKKAKDYNAQGKAMAWIFTITRNHSLMKLRERSKNAHTNLDDIYDIGSDEDIINETYTENLVNLLLKTLKADERQIVVMHSMSNMKHKDIADVLDIPISTVISKYNRSLKKLKAEMEVNEYEI